MKKLISILVIITILLGAYVAAGPYIVVNKIQTAIKNQDSMMLSKYVDFPVLRENLKEQINATMLETLMEEMDEDPFAMFGIAFLALIIDGLVDLLLTPSGLGALAVGIEPDLASGDIEEFSPEQADLFVDARYTLDSFSRVSLWLKNESNEDLRFIFYRHGITWRLSNIVIPF